VTYYVSLDHTQTHTTVGRTPLYEGSARRRELYLTKHKHSQETNIHAPGGMPVSAWPQTYALDRAATGIGELTSVPFKIGFHTTENTAFQLQTRKI
jgi:hypothetical protein